MTGKERAKAAINLQSTDRVPLGFYVADYDTIEKVIGRKTYVRNKIASQVAFWEGRRDEVVESYKKDTVEFYRKMPLCDIICFKEAPFVPPRGYQPEDQPRRTADDTWEDRRGRVYKVSELSNMIECVHNPEAQEREYTIEMFQRPVDETPPDPSIFEAVDYVIEQLGAERYIAGHGAGLNVMPTLGGTEAGLMRYLLEPELVKAAIQFYARQANAREKHYLRPGQDGVLFEQDMAASKGPMISPTMWREFCFAALKSRCATIRAAGKQVLMHNCGNNRPLIPMFIDAGVQCYQSLQNIPDMEIGGLKRDFGDRLCFWGGIALDDLIQGVPAAIRKNVRAVLERAAPGGGFILGPSHSIALGTKYDNFMAMLDEFDRWNGRRG